MEVQEGLPVMRLQVAARRLSANGPGGSTAIRHWPWPAKVKSTSQNGNGPDILKMTGHLVHEFKSVGI
jgi:hypothetical protein